MKNLWLFIKFKVTGRVNVIDFGAIPDSGIDATGAFQRAVDFAHDYGGGTIKSCGRFVIKNCVFIGKQRLSGRMQGK